MNKGFWNTLKKPIIALSPMDGVTDAPFRYIIDRYSDVEVLFTEFTNVEGIARGKDKLLDAFIHHKTKTPTVAQIFGTEPEAFYQATFVVCEMGFDGVDINMGCPDPNVSKRGAGAGLILNAKLAQTIIHSVQKAAIDWYEGRNITEVGLSDTIVDYIHNFQKKFAIFPERTLLPVSVKTRIGYDKIVTEEWIQTLLETQPVNISLHGRTLKQLYSGEANWDEIGKAAQLATKTETTLLGNGDIKSLVQAHERIQQYKTDGVLIGRSAIGNPWVFTDTTADKDTRLSVAIDHCKIFEDFLPQGHFLSMRKHLAWYAKNFDGASDLRVRLLQTKSAAEVEEIIGNF